MSVHVSSLVWKMDVPATAKLVLLKLADHARDDGSGVYPSQKSVAQECGLSDRSVRNVISEAIERGVLEEVPTPGNRPNEYRFVMEQVELRSRWKDVPGGISRQSSRNHVPPRRNHVPAINKKHQLTIKEPSISKCDDFAGAECPVELYDSARCWQAYRTSRRLSAYVKATWESKFKTYRGRGSDFARDVSYSIEQGYNGIFAPRNHREAESMVSKLERIGAELGGAGA